MTVFEYIDVLLIAFFNTFTYIFKSFHGFKAMASSALSTLCTHIALGHGAEKC